MQNGGSTHGHGAGPACHPRDGRATPPFFVRQYLDGEAFPDVQQVDPDLLQDLPAAPQPLVPEQKEVPAEAAVGEVPLRAAEEQCAWDTV